MKKSISIFLVYIFTLFLVCSALLQTDTGVVKHSGMCDASAAVAIGPSMFVVANDEDNMLRVYRNSKDDKPVHQIDLTSFLKTDKKHPETDIEAATRVGDRIYWITSHGANKNGKHRPSRHRLFATDVKFNENDRITITPVGTPYKNLVKDLIANPELMAFNFDAAISRPPKDFGALNIEGLCATPDGSLLIGFRNPIPDGKALLLPLENPQDVIAGKTAKLGKPILLFLDGLGIRSIEYFPVQGKYLIIAGAHGEQGTFKLYQWSGNYSDMPEWRDSVDFNDLNPEAMIIYPTEMKKIQVLSDDGARKVKGKECKKTNTHNQSFRSIWLTL